MEQDTSVPHQIALETTRNDRGDGGPLDWWQFDQAVMFVDDTIERLAEGC